MSSIVTRKSFARDAAQPRARRSGDTLRPVFGHPDSEGSVTEQLIAHEGREIALLVYCSGMGAEAIEKAARFLCQRLESEARTSGTAVEGRRREGAPARLTYFLAPGISEVAWRALAACGVRSIDSAVDASWSDPRRLIDHLTRCHVGTRVEDVPTADSRDSTVAGRSDRSPLLTDADVLAPQLTEEQNAEIGEALLWLSRNGSPS